MHMVPKEIESNSVGAGSRGNLSDVVELKTKQINFTDEL